MKRVAPIKFAYVYLDDATSGERTEMAYARIFRQAWKNIVDKESTEKYSERVYE
ncbi:MAG: hypothetical protein V1487_02680 [bacterium]